MMHLDLTNGWTSRDFHKLDEIGNNANPSEALLCENKKIQEQNVTTNGVFP